MPQVLLAAGVISGSLLAYQGRGAMSGEATATPARFDSDCFDSDC